MLIQFHTGAMGYDTMTYWSNGTLIQCHTGAMGRWYNDILEQWDVAMIYWSNGTLVQ